MENHLIASSVSDEELSGSVLLSVVVPISRLADHKFQIEDWVTKSVELGIHIILVHDLSAGSSGDFLEELGKKYPNQVSYCEGRFGNPGAARNRGLKEVRGTWVSFWDADDIPKPESFLEMVKDANRGNYDTSIGQYEEFDMRTGLSKHHPLTLDNSALSSYQIARNPGIWRMSFKWDSVRECLFPNRDMGEDQIFLITSKIRFDKIYLSNLSVYRYSCNFPGQLTQMAHRYESLQLLFETELNDGLKSLTRFNLVTALITLRIWLSLVSRGRKKNQLRNLFLITRYLLRMMITNSKQIWGYSR